MKVPLLDLKAQYKDIKNEIQAAMEEVLESQYFILGPKVTALEVAISAYSDSKHAVGVSSGSDALLICLMAENIGPGDEVITTPYTFFATAGAISRVGAKPVFVDIQPDTYNIDPNLIEAKVTQRTKALIPVHLYGQCADMDPIMSIAKKRGLVVIEDAAQAIGSECVLNSPAAPRVRRAGSIGDYGCFSFFPSKNLGGFGDGGMVVTNDPDKAERLRILRAHGSKPKYYHKFIGGNFRLDALHAAVLLAKLQHLDEWTAARQKNAMRYDELFDQSGVVQKKLVRLPARVWKGRLNTESVASIDGIPNVGKHDHIFNQYVISVSPRDKVKSYLNEKGVGTEIYYPVPLHLQECFSYLGYSTGSFPISETASNNTLALPIYPELTQEQQEYVVQSITEALS